MRLFGIELNPCFTPNNAPTTAAFVSALPLVLY